MNALEKLQQIGTQEISAKTHISIEEMRAILEERFDRFNRTKAVGFIKILEREYDVDLSEWMTAFDEANTQNTDGEEIFVYAKSDEGSTARVVSILFIAVVVGAVAFFFWRSSTPPPVTTQSDPQTLVGEAKEAIAVAAQEEAQALAPVEVEAKEVILQEPARMEFYVESEVDLWVGSYYTQTAQRDGRIIQGRFDLDKSQDQVITFGHGRFTLVYGEQRFSPDNDQLHRFRLRDGVLSQMSAPRPATRSQSSATDSNQSE